MIPARKHLRRLAFGGALGLSAVGCQQKMADQPAPRPYEAAVIEGTLTSSARLLPDGVIHRGQAVDGEPLATWLTEKGHAPQVSPEWRSAVDSNGTTQPTAGAPTSLENFVTEFPFEITPADLVRGQKMYNAVCAQCHGGAGYGNGKIPERGFLKPPSYHTDPAGEQRDAGHFVGEAIKDLAVGYSRGFDRYGIKVPLKEVPIGYIYQVISWGYGGMGSHETQLPMVPDRWRVIAYVRTLQYSQAVPADELAADTKQRIESGKGRVPLGAIATGSGSGTVTTTSAGDGPGTHAGEGH